MSKPQTWGEMRRTHPNVDYRHMSIALASFYQEPGDGTYHAVFDDHDDNTPMEGKLIFVYGIDVLTTNWFSVYAACNSLRPRNRVRMEAVSRSIDLVVIKDWIHPSHIGDTLYFRDEADAVNFAVWVKETDWPCA